MVGLADRVLALRVRLGLTVEELARRLGVDKSTVSRWETGKQGIRARMLARLETVERGRCGAN